MPVSSYVGKNEMVEHIQKYVDKSSWILDVGVGEGTYSTLLKPLGYNNIDAIEVFEPYIDRYNLPEKYSTVFLIDVLNFDFSKKHYDCVILGDVLEHIEPVAARKLIDTLLVSTDNIIISVPYNNVQGPYKGNVYETHRQPDLTPELFKQRYPEFTCIAEGKHHLNPAEHIGAWIWRRE